MQEMRVQGLFYRAIAEALQAKNRPTKNGKGRWHATTVMKILKSLANKFSADETGDEG